MHILCNTLLFLVLVMVTTSGLAQVKTFNKRLYLGQRTMATFDSLPGETTCLLSLDGYSPGVYFLQNLEKGGMTRAEPFVVNN